MKRLIVIITSVLLIVFISFAYYKTSSQKEVVNGAPPYSQEDLDPPNDDVYSWLRGWRRPEGPAKVALQVGHFRSHEFPDELKRLRGNTGSSGGGKLESEVNMVIATLTAEILKQKGVEVEILPATIPEKYLADVFVAIHADGAEDKSKNGFKLSSPRRDYSGNAKTLLNFIEEDYQRSTNLEIDPNVTRNMRGYYAFAWWRYDHAVHPMTASVILETGFLSSPHDRKVIVNKPELSASGLALGILKYLVSEDLL